MHTIRPLKVQSLFPRSYSLSLRSFLFAVYSITEVTKQLLLIRASFICLIATSKCYSTAPWLLHYQKQVYLRLISRGEAHFTRIHYCCSYSHLDLQNHQYCSYYFSIREKVNQQRISKEVHHQFHSFSTPIIPTKSFFSVLFDRSQPTILRLFISLP